MSRSLAGEQGAPGARRFAQRLRQLDSEALFQIALVLVVGFLVLYPVFWVLEAGLRTSIFERDYTLAWYHRVFVGDLATTAALLANTLQIALGGTALAVVIGTGVALLVARTDMPGRTVFSVLFIAPFFLTPMIMAVAWTLLASPRIGIFNELLRWLFGLQLLTGPLNIYSIGGMVWVIGLYLSPYVYLFVSAALRSLDPSLEEAARMSGAGALRTLLTVTLPLMRPAIYSAALLSLVLGFSQWGVPAILGIPARQYVLTTAIWSHMSAWPTEREYAAVLSVVLLAVAFAAIAIQRRALGDRSYVTVTGRGYRPPSVQLGAWRWPVTLFAWGFTLLTGLMPMLALAYASFNRRWTTAFRPDLFTFDNYLNLATIEPRAFTALRNSLVLALIGATLVVAVTLVAALIIMRRRDRLGRALDYLAMLPVSIPSIVFAVGLLAAYLRPPLVLYGTPWILLLAYVTLLLPVGVRAASAALAQLDLSLEEAARMSGAGWLRRMATILVPLLRPGLVAGWVLIFISLMKEVSASILLGSPAVPVSATVMWSMWTLGAYTALAAYEVIATLLMATVAGLALALGGRAALRRAAT